MTPRQKFVIAKDRPEHEPCQAGTPGCCVDHNKSDEGVPCQTW